MLQDLIAYLMVFLSALYLVQHAVRKKQVNCCRTKTCAAVSQSLLQIGPLTEPLKIEN